MLSNDLVMEKLERNINRLAILCVICTIASVAMYYRFSYYGDLWVNFIGWLSILVLLAAGKRNLNQRTDFGDFYGKFLHRRCGKIDP